MIKISNKNCSSNKNSVFNKIKISLASPENVLKWSNGEVKTSETLNYRTLKPENNGLFCERIFGPLKNYECSCGKIKDLINKKKTCPDCGVKIISSHERRKRMGHIQLASDVAHIWFLKSLPCRIGLILNLSLKDLEKVVYFESYIVLKNGPKKKLKRGTLLTVEEYKTYKDQYGDGFTADIGAPAITKLLHDIDLTDRIQELKIKSEKSNSENSKKKISKQIKLIEAFIKSGNKPEWMMIKILPVLPPGLRPLVSIEGGKMANSDINNLYRRVINRNNRLKRILTLSVPDSVKHNEQRMLQQAVDALLDNGRSKAAMLDNHKRPLKSLSDVLKGKTGIFRNNLLGKRVDYSGRSVIIVGPNLKLNQCGLPKQIALELFKPFIYKQLYNQGLSNTIQTSKKVVYQESQYPIVWDILANILKQHPILLNRAPTLHRLGIQAFEPILVEGKAIQLHPLVCAAYNADFDGDQMAVHVPLTIEAQVEARTLMMSGNNILSPANGEPILTPTQDIVLGLYYLTKNTNILDYYNSGRLISNHLEAIYLYDSNYVCLQDKINLLITEYTKQNNDWHEQQSIVNTTIGRAILWDIVPKGLKFELINKTLDKSDISKLIKISYTVLGVDQTIIFLDKLMKIGFKYATKSGISICLNDMVIPTEKQDILAYSEASIKEQFDSGLFSSKESNNKIIDIWSKAHEKITKSSIEYLANKWVIGEEGLIVEKKNEDNSLFIMANSGARGSSVQIKQLSGMRGLMTKPDGSIIETPIKSNLREGLNVLQYFISTHGARKGLADTALKTANSGYLTRRLVDVAQDLVITEDNCGTDDGVIIKPVKEGGVIIESLKEKILGRMTAEKITINSKILIEKDTLLEEEHCNILEDYFIDSVKVRSVITCNAKYGACTYCYGADLSKGKLITQGEAIGVIAAQSIGEPGTQLTMRTFHIGGTATRSVVESNIKVKNNGIMHLINANKSVLFDHNHIIITSKNVELEIVNDDKLILENYILPYGAIVKNDGYKVTKGEIIAYWDPHNIPIFSEVNGYVKFFNLIEGQSLIKKKDEVTGLTYYICSSSSYEGEEEEPPLLKIVDEMDNEVLLPGTDIQAIYLLPNKSILNLTEGIKVNAGDILARIPISYENTDITGGLTRVEDVFEVRKNATATATAILAEISGIVYFGQYQKGKRILIIKSKENDNSFEHNIPQYKYLTVEQGDYVNKGDRLTDGKELPHDILRLRGIKALQNYIINEVQAIYRSQGVKINDKHIETIIRQMLKTVTITHPGDTDYLVGDKLHLSLIDDINQKLLMDGKKPAKYSRNLLGITKASLSNESFISAASFQETTRVLAEAAISSKKDELKGLKENVILGRLIPAGTGYYYNKHKEALKKINTEMVE